LALPASGIHGDLIGVFRLARGFREGHPPPNSPVRTTVKLPVLLFLAIFPLAGIAEQFDRSSVRALCAEAKAIVVGSVIDGDRVRVEKWIQPDPSTQPLPETITIARLSQHRLRPGWPSNIPQPAELPVRRFVAFLKQKDGHWECLSTVADPPAGAECGSSGLFWILDDTCYAYCQYASPGPYYLCPVADLRRDSDFHPHIDWLEPVTNEALLLAEIDAGLKDLAAWNAALAEPDPTKKAMRLAAYYLPGTSPVGKRRTFRFKVEDHLSKLEGAAVPALVKALESRQPGDDLTALLWTLRRFPVNTEAAIPELNKLLGSPLERPPLHVLECLARTQNPLIAPAVWPFLFSPYPEVREGAAFALESIVAEGASPEELASQSPIIALVHLVPPAALSPENPTPALARAILQQNLKGTLPKYFRIEPLPGLPAGEQRVSDRRALVFLRQDRDGRFFPTTPASLKPCLSGGDRVEWPRLRSLPLETIQEAIHATAPDVSPSGS
jgi:hypothetical protein